MPSKMPSKNPFKNLLKNPMWGGQHARAQRPEKLGNINNIARFQHLTLGFPRLDPWWPKLGRSCPKQVHFYAVMLTALTPFLRNMFLLMLWCTSVLKSKSNRSVHITPFLLFGVPIKDEMKRRVFLGQINGLHWVSGCNFVFAARDAWTRSSSIMCILS